MNFIELVEKDNYLELDLIEEEKKYISKKANSYEEAYFISKKCLEVERYEDALFYVDQMIKLIDREFLEEELEVFITTYRFVMIEKRKEWRKSYK